MQRRRRTASRSPFGRPAACSAGGGLQGLDPHSFLRVLEFLGDDDVLRVATLSPPSCGAVALLVGYPGPVLLVPRAGTSGLWRHFPLCATRAIVREFSALQVLSTHCLTGAEDVLALRRAVRIASSWAECRGPVRHFFCVLEFGDAHVIQAMLQSQEEQGCEASSEIRIPDTSQRVSLELLALDGRLWLSPRFGHADRAAPATRAMHAVSAENAEVSLSISRSPIYERVVDEHLVEHGGHFRSVLQQRLALPFIVSVESRPKPPRRRRAKQLAVLGEADSVCRASHG